MIVQLLRHATLIIELGGIRILVDPMFAAAGATDAIANTPNQRRNPLLDLPCDDEALDALLRDVDGVIVTHLHNDHWDQQARDLLPKRLPIFCQPPDRQRIEEAGYLGVQPVAESLEWKGLQITRTGGQHGRGKIGKLMAPVSGFVLQAEGESGVYIAGDTVWCDDVEAALDQHRPDVVVVNAGAAQFNSGGVITMDVADVIAVAKAAPDATVIAVHMEAINHCLLSRSGLREAVDIAGVGEKVGIPEDGEKKDLG